MLVEMSRILTVRNPAFNTSIILNPSDAETYICAVAACGGTWFGNDTKVDIQGTITDWGIMV